MPETPHPSPTLLPATANGVEMVAKFFRALGDPARLRLLEFLLNEEHTVSECIAHIGLSQGRISTHYRTAVMCSCAATAAMPTTG